METPNAEPSPRRRIAGCASSSAAGVAARRPPVVFELDKLEVYYGAFRAVRDVSLTIHENQITAFIGPSGCGKTTVLRCLNRMNDLIPGARVGGKRHATTASISTATMSRRPRCAAASAWCSRSRTRSRRASTTTSRSARASTASATAAELDEIVEKSLRAAALWDEVKDRLKHSALGMSGGQQQRLCIARTIAVEPEVVLMDEPCSALDPIATARIEELMRELKRTYTIVIVTHNMQQAARVSDRTAFFTAELDSKNDQRTGMLVEYDATAKIFSNPRDERTENYITGRFG